MRPVYIDVDCIPSGALYAQEKVDGWGVEVYVRSGRHTVRLAKTGKVLWTEDAGGPDGLYLGEWVHGTQRSLTDPRRGKVALYECDGPWRYDLRLGHSARIARANPCRYCVVDTYPIDLGDGKPVSSLSWDTAMDNGWEGIIYRTDYPGYVWRRKRSVELDGVVVEVLPTKIIVRCYALACDVTVAAGLSADLRPRVGEIVRITGMEITAAGKVREPVLRGVKGDDVCPDCRGNPCVCEIESGEKCWCSD